MDNRHINGEKFTLKVFPTIIFPPFCSEVFCNQNKNDVLKEGETIKYPKLAETYKTVAEKGAQAFYEGPLAQNLVTDIQAASTSLFYPTASSD